MDFSKMVKEVEKGDLPMSFEAAGQFVKDQVAYEFGQSKKSLVYILMLAVIAAVFANFSGIFPNRQISEISFLSFVSFYYLTCA